MKPFFLSISFLFFCELLVGQGQWVWLKGDKLRDLNASYGTKGVEDPGNDPGSRYEATNWQDAQGNFYLYSGNAKWVDAALWKYDPATNNWTWISGSFLQNPAPVYGTQGVPSVNNHPGAREFGVASWVDQSGNFWMYGGWNGSAGKSDMWHYNPGTNEWTWMQGSKGVNQDAVHGTKGVSDPANTPGGRQENIATWVDAAGNLWMYGGQSFATSTGGNFGDLWMYDVSINEWTWMDGVKTFPNPGRWGTKGVEHPANDPGYRIATTTWVGPDGNFWLFGGYYGGSWPSNDLWRYNISTQNWTWMKGDSVKIPSFIQRKGTYGSKCVPDDKNTPGARYETKTRWTDHCGNLWLFSGNTNHADFWRYHVANDQWTWIGGDSSGTGFGAWGIKGVPDPANTPPDRGGAVPWKNQDGFFMFGGDSYNGGYRNDLWQYQFDPPVAAFTINDTLGCAPHPVNVTDGSTANCDSIESWAWDFGDPASGAANYDSTRNATHTYTDSGTYTIRLIVANCLGGKDTLHKNVYVVSPKITLSADKNICPGDTIQLQVDGGDSYNWTPGDGSLSCTDCANPIASPATSTSYTVYVSDSLSGCTQQDTVNVIVSDSLLAFAGPDTSICPGDTVQLIGSGGSAYSWSPATGLSNSSVASPFAFPASNMTYTLTISSGNCAPATDVVSIGVFSFSAEAGQDTSTCAGAPISLSASGGSSYQWLPAGTLSSDTIANPVASPSATATYTVLITNGVCLPDTDSVTVSVISAPPADAGSDAVICAGDSIQLNSSGGGDYQWIPGAGLSDAQVSNPLAFPEDTTIYTLVTRFGNCLPDTDQVIIAVMPMPVVSFLPDTSRGCPTLCVQFNNSSGLHSRSCHWDFGDGNQAMSCDPIHCYEKTGKYRINLSLTDSNGCTGFSPPGMVRVHGIPEAGFSMEPPVTDIFNAAIQFYDNSIDAVSWEWHFGDSANSTSIEENPAHIYGDTGSYQVRLIVENEYSCVDTIYHTLIIRDAYTIYVPNAFSPNGDGLNDVFNFKGTGIDPDEFEMWIFDRWGNRIFHTEDMNEGWDGRANGGTLTAQQDVYVWIIEAQDFNLEKYRLMGHVSLIR